MSRLYRWYRITARRKGRLVAVSVAGFALALFGSRFLPRVYEARTLISVRPAAVPAPAAPEADAGRGGSLQAASRSPREAVTRSEFLSEVLS
ncbi:MAG TPA: hypothetical protein ENN74_00780, partial [Firmicutes bacterium]|nr:hypothetical protein [Bacillota bacterium]